jgi:tetratricopeptide (TPR) repeat protein
MKRIAFLILAVCILLSGTIVFAADLPWSEVAAGYYRSYEHEQQKQYGEAIRDLEAVQKTYPNTYTVNYRIGWLYYLDKNNSKAMEHLKKALVISPNSVEVMNTITLVHVAEADWHKVEEQSLRVLKADYYNLTGNYWYSHSLKMQKKYNYAIKVDRKMLSVYPTSTVFLQELGENLLLDNKKEESAAVFSSLKVLIPGDTTANAGTIAGRNVNLKGD